ncbi:hypothetical protein, partial [Streptomyces sp. NPDC021115]
MRKKTPPAPAFDLNPEALAAFVTAQQNTGKQPKSSTLQQWATNNKGRLAVASATFSMGPAGDLLSAAPDGWRTALTLGAAGTAAAGAWGWLPGLVKWRGQWRPARTLPNLTDQRVGLSMPLTGGALLTTLAATGGPEWGENPGWGFALVWSAAYATWVWRRWGRRPTVKAPTLTQQMLDWEQYAAVSEGPYPKSKLTSPVANPKGGWSGEIVVPRGRTFEMRLKETASALDIDDLDLITLEPLGPRRGRVSVFAENPLKKGTLFGDNNVIDLETGLAPIGVYYDGELANYRFWLPGSGAVHDFITGTSGSGKSRTVDALLGMERRCPLVCSIVIDPQAGLSLPDWPDGVAVFAPGNDLGIVTLRAVAAWMKNRADRYSRMRWTDDKGRERIGRAFFVPGDPDPFVVLTIEEAHDLLNDPDHGEEAVKLLGDMSKEVRKVGLKLRVCNQGPNAEELGGKTLIRDILQGGNNLVLRSGSAATGKRAAGSALAGVDPGAIPREFADGTSTGGLGYLAGPDNRTAMWRAPYVEDPYALAHEGETTGIEQAALDGLPILRHVVAEHALMLELRNAGKRYVYDPGRFTEQPTAAPAARTSMEKAPAPVVAPAGPSLSGTTRRIVEYLQDLGKASTPALISKALGLPNPQIRKA